MKILKIIVIVLMFGVAGIFGSEIGERLSIPGAQNVVPTAEARVGRPLTPVSVAGVARRTVRRCAVGVYNCNLPAPWLLDSLSEQISVESNRIERQQSVFPYLLENVRPEPVLVRTGQKVG